MMRIDVKSATAGKTSYYNNGGSTLEEGTTTSIGSKDSQQKRNSIIRSGSYMNRLLVIVVLLMVWFVGHILITSKVSFEPVTKPKSGLLLSQKESFGFFDDLSDEDWKLRQEILANVHDHEDPEDPDPYDDDSWEKYFQWYQYNYEPNFSCSFERRVGGNGNGDGPKWVCDPHRITRLAKERRRTDESQPGCVIYSIGSNGDFQFELGMQDIVGVGTCEIHIFDMGDYEKEMPSELKNAHYHQWGIKAQDSLAEYPPQPGQEFYGLKDTMILLGHETLESIDVFKIDCEGCEWTSFSSWLDPNLPELRQILVELHKPPASIATTFFDTLQAAGYVRFHKEVNTICPEAGAVEYSFLKLSTDFFPKEKLIIPTRVATDDETQSIDS